MGIAYNVGIKLIPLEICLIHKPYCHLDSERWKNTYTNAATQMKRLYIISQERNRQK